MSASLLVPQQRTLVPVRRVAAPAHHGAVYLHQASRPRMPVCDLVSAVLRGLVFIHAFYVSEKYRIYKWNSGSLSFQ